MKADLFELYHGTTSLFLEHILERGLLPGTVSGIQNYPTLYALSEYNRNNRVYLALTSEDALCWANNTVNGRGGYPVVVKVEVPIQSLSGEYEGEPLETSVLSKRRRCTHIGAIPRIAGFKIYADRKKIVEEYPESGNILKKP